MVKLSPKVKDILRHAVQSWAEENLPGRPAILGAAVYNAVEKCLIQQQEKIELRFPLEEQNAEKGWDSNGTNVQIDVAPSKGDRQ